jgi:hypothetical protein
VRYAINTAIIGNIWEEPGSTKLSFLLALYTFPRFEQIRDRLCPSLVLYLIPALLPLALLALHLRRTINAIVTSHRGGGEKVFRF